MITPAPPHPSNVRVSQNGLNSILVTWTPSEGPNVTGYTVIYQQIDGGLSGSVTAKNTDTNINITGLIAGASFSIGVLANSSQLPSTVTYGPAAIGTVNITSLQLTILSVSICSTSQHLS